MCTVSRNRRPKQSFGYKVVKVDPAGIWSPFYSYGWKKGINKSCENPLPISIESSVFHEDGFHLFTSIKNARKMLKNRRACYICDDFCVIIRVTFPPYTAILGRNTNVSQCVNGTPSIVASVVYWDGKYCEKV